MLGVVSKGQMAVAVSITLLPEQRSWPLAVTVSMT